MPLKFANFKSRGQAAPIRCRRKFFYSKKTYANPFFRHKKTGFARAAEPGRGSRLKLFGFAGAIIFIILIWLMFFSNLFKITAIQVSGVDGSQAAEVEKIARELAVDKLLGKNSLLFYSKTDLTQLLNEKYYLESLDIKRSWPHTLKIALAQKRQAAVWLEADKYYYLDASGAAITQVDPLNLNRAAYPLILNLTGVLMSGRQANISPEAVQYVIALFDEFKDKKHGFELENFIVDEKINTVTLAVLGGPKIYFNLKADLNEQTAKLDLIISDKLKQDFTKKTYVDLRFGTNVYIK